MIINKTYDEFKKDSNFSDEELPQTVIMGRPVKNEVCKIEKILSFQPIEDDIGFCIASFKDKNKEEFLAVRWYKKGHEGFPVLKKTHSAGAWLYIPNESLEDLEILIKQKKEED